MKWVLQKNHFFRYIFRLWHNDRVEYYRICMVDIQEGEK